jgi:AraC-like DNA-binding protein
VAGVILLSSGEEGRAVLEKPATSDSPRPQVTLLNAGALDAVCVRGHVVPSQDLAAIVAVGWTLTWKVPDGEAFRQQVLPNPSAQIVVDAYGRAEVWGIVTGAFSTKLEGQGFLFGLRMKPCGFHAIVKEPVARFTNRRVPLAAVLPAMNSERLLPLAASTDASALMACLEEGLRAQAPRVDETAARLELLISEMEADSQMMTVDQAARCFATSSRTLQRLFHEYVGVSPKWILRRLRLKEAAARLEHGEAANIADLAQRLGYYDQAHLNRDFRALIGRPPGAWARQMRCTSVG